MNPDQFIYSLMKENNLETQEQVALLLGLTSTSLSGWKKRGSVPKKYLIKYQNIIGATHKPGQPGQVSKPKTEYCKMYKYGDHLYTGRNEKGQLERVYLKTGTIEVDIKGIWVDKSTQ